MSNQVPPDALWPLLAGVQATQLLYVMAKLRLADALANGPCRAETLAARLAVDTGALGRALDGLAALGMVERRVDRTYALTPCGEHLRAESAGSMHDWAIVAGELHFPAWGGLLHSVRTGAPGFDAVAGESMWTYIGSRPELADSFYRAIGADARATAAAVAAAFASVPPATIVDVGGGHGVLLAALLQTLPDARGVIVETPPILAAAKDHLTREGVIGRSRLVAGSFFDAIPPDGDLYVLGNVLHDWDDQHCRRILRACRSAMGTDARLAVIEVVRPDRLEDLPFVVQIDLQLLVATGGRKRTLAEHRALLDSEGFAFRGLTSTGSFSSLMCAAPVAAPAEVMS